jgi:endonuclease YncB( thermonuclease family)
MISLRSFWEILKFIVVLLVVLAVLQRFGVVDILPGQVTVIDGDSLREGKTEIRLYGIDAPEYRQTCKDATQADYDCGKRAREALWQLIRQGELKCKSLDIDRYGRSISNCQIGALDVNREMVAQGWAVAFVQFGLDYVGEEKTARQNKRGLWAGSFEEPAQYRKRMRNLNGDVTGLPDLPPD